MLDETSAVDSDDSDLDEFDRRNDWSWSAMAERWSQDRGTLLIGVAGIVAVAGSVVIATQQNRFRPVTFPDGAAIQRSRDLGLTAALPTADAEESDLLASDLTGVGFELHGVTVQRGPVLVAIYDSNEAFDQNNFAESAGRLQIASDQSIARWQIPVEELPARFAVAAFQDFDGNGQLSRGPLGIPSEPYGFSRDARATLGRPGYDAAVIDRPELNSAPVLFELK